MSTAEDFALKDTNEELNDLRDDNDKLRFKVGRLQEQVSSQKAEFDEFHVTSQDVLRKEQVTVDHEMKRIQLRSLLSLLTENNLRRAFHAFEANRNFTNKKQALLEKMPLPRRKKWWEKLAEH